MMYDSGFMGGSAYNYAIFSVNNGNNRVSIFSLSGYVLASRVPTGKINARHGNEAIITDSGETYLVTNFNEFAIAGSSLNLTNMHWSDGVYASPNLSLVLSRGEDNNWGSIDKLASDFPISTEYLWITCAIANDRTVLIIVDNSTGSAPVMISADNGVTFQDTGITVDFYSAKAIRVYDSVNYSVYGSGVLKCHNSTGWHNIGALNIRAWCYDGADTIFLLCQEEPSYKLYKLTVSTQVLTLLYTEAYVAQNIGSMSILDEMIFIPMTRYVRVLSITGVLINNTLAILDSLNIAPTVVTKNI